MKYLLGLFLLCSCLIAEEENDALRTAYFLNHTGQTLEFVLKKQAQYLPPHIYKMSLWDALRLIDTLKDESLPVSKCRNSLDMYRRAEAMRRDGQPRWMILTAFIADLGRILAFHGEPQWAVTGETFPVGCAFSPKIVFGEDFRFNADRHVPRYQTKLGIYNTACGLDNLNMSWGKDEYLYHVTKDFLPPEATFIIRYHSFYSLYKQGAYKYFLSERDQELLPLLELFDRYEQAAQHEIVTDPSVLKPYYEALISEFFPAVLTW